MERHVIIDGRVRYERISKREARKLFTEGKPFYIIAHKMRPGFPFSLGMTIDPTRYQDEDKDFDWCVQNFEWHNANSFETGTYSAFYTVTE